MTCAGTLRERISFQEETETPDGYGGKTLTWGNIASTPTVWAEVTPVRGTEAEDAGRLATKQTYLLTIRYRSDFDPQAGGTAEKYRIVWGSVTMNIRSIQNRDRKKQWLTIEAQSGVTN